MRRFDAQALRAALDQQRVERGMTWAEVSVEIGVSASTMTRLQLGGRLEVDGVLAMVGWLGRPVEDFVREASR
jgi:hypothetical protein